MRVWSSLIVLAAACGSSSAPASHAVASGGTPPAPAPPPDAMPLRSAGNRAVLDGLLDGGAPDLARVHDGTPVAVTEVAVGSGSGDYPRAEIEAGIRARQGTLRACYEQALKVHPGLAGKVTATFTIGADGAVSDASARGVDPDLDACLEKQIRSLRFAAPAAGPVNVSYPFVFAS